MHLPVILAGLAGLPTSKLAPPPRDSRYLYRAPEQQDATKLLHQHKPSRPYLRPHRHAPQIDALRDPSTLIILAIPHDAMPACSLKSITEPPHPSPMHVEHLYRDWP